MRTVYDTILACRNDSGKLAKIAFLEAQKDNNDLKRFLQVCYEQKINFFMRKLRPELAGSFPVSDDVHFTRELLEDLVENLSTRKITGNQAKAWVATLHDKLQGWERELLELLIGRDVRAGFSESTINKVWPELVTDVPYMRCCLPKEAKMKNWDWSKGVYSQIKADGMFQYAAHHADGIISMMSRAGTPMPIEYFKDIVAELRDRVPAGMQASGELLMTRNGEILPRQIGNGYFNSLINDGELEDPTLIPIYQVWDIMPISEMKPKNKYKVPYKTRFEQVINLFSGSAFVKAIESKIVYSIKEAYEHYKEALERGLEGTIVKYPDAIWEDTTSKLQVKLKLEADVELKIVGFTEGTGKNKDLFGSIMLESEDGLLVVNCGSGFPDKPNKVGPNAHVTRAFIHSIRDELIGAVITVRSNMMLVPSGSKTTWSLFLPRFIEIRYDKKEADTLQRIKDQFDAAVESILDLVE